MLVWRIYYADGSACDNTKGEWNEAPLDGVVAVCIKDETWGRQIYFKREFYLPGDTKSPGSTFGVDDLGAHLRAHCPWIKHGLCISRENYKEILQEAMDDPDFPRWSPRRRSTD